MVAKSVPADKIHHNYEAASLINILCIQRNKLMYLLSILTYTNCHPYNHY